MKTAIVTLKSQSPYSQSRHYDVPKLDRELAKDFEARTWRERCHVDDKGKLFIPPMAFKNCLAEAAQFLGEKIPGKRNATWTKHFLSGVLVTEAMPLPITKAEVKGEWLFVPSDGQVGGAKRVDKCFPIIHEWSGQVTFYVLDEIITEDAFTHHLTEAGKFIGLGRFRPRRGGYYGRFSVEKVSWK